MSSLPPTPAWPGLKHVVPANTSCVPHEQLAVILTHCHGPDDVTHVITWSFTGVEEYACLDYFRAS